MANNYRKFAAVIAEFAGMTLSTKALTVLLAEKAPELKLANLFPAACSVSKLPDTDAGEHYNAFRAPSSAPYPVLFLLSGRGNYTVLEPTQQYWPEKQGRATKQSLEDAQAEITRLRELIAAKQATV